MNPSGQFIDLSFLAGSSGAETLSRPGLSGQPEPTLRNDVALDLVRSAGDAIAGHSVDDYLMGQWLGGVSSAWASSTLKPNRYIGLDPALTAGALTALALRVLGPLQRHLPDAVLSRVGMPPKGAAPDTMERVRAMWSKWDSSMMQRLVKSGRRTPFPVGPPSVPSTLVLADPSLFVPPKMAAELSVLGWDIRVKPGGEHDLHLQDPSGVIAMLDAVFREGTASS